MALPDGICYGATDVESSPDLCNARKLLEGLRKDPPARLYSSPLKRCQTLASHIGRANLDARLRELDFGEWEMRQWDTVDRQHLEAWRADPLNWRAPRGESLVELATRVAQFLQELGTDDPPSACVVTHAGVIRAASCLLFAQNLAEALHIVVPPAAGLRFDWRPRRTRLLETFGFDNVRLPQWFAG